MNTLRTTAIGLSALLLLGLSAAPAQAADTDLGDIIGPVTPNYLCPPENPTAWVNYCVQLIPYPSGVWAYEVDTTPETTLVCPHPSICANVPILLELVDEKFYPATLYRLAYTITPNGSQIHEDICDVIGVHCAPLKTILESLQPITSESSASTSTMPHGLQLEGVGDVGGDGTLDLAFFTLPSGQTIALDLQ